MSYHIRPENPATDFPRVAELLNTYRSKQVDAKTLLHLHNSRPAAAFFHRLMLVDSEGQIAGFCNISRNPWDEAGSYHCWLIIDPKLRNQGLGSMLYQAMISYLKELGATKIKSDVRDDLPDSLHFAKQRHLEKRAHLFQSSLDLHAFDIAPFEDTVPQVEATGIRFATLADYEDSEAVRRKLYELTMIIERDIPDSEDDLPEFDDWCQYVFGDETQQPDTRILAISGDEWIGLAVLRYTAGSDYMYHAISGIHPDYRGRKLGQALKVLTINCANRYGVRKLVTDNHSANGPMIAINKKFGYQPQPGSYLLNGQV